ncbi:MAG TPA: winged helix-turn-helix domain-containing protein [Streptosporangiaceae bacterium]|nr:winged helix-turn-helix domain-containing protein [Streptosporangiaceae bacterium]
MIIVVVPPFDPDADPSAYLYESMAAHIEARIRAGELVKGNRLPNERDLAAEYGVSVQTARHAVRMLRDRGLLITRAVKGTFVA